MRKVYAFYIGVLISFFALLYPEYVMLEDVCCYVDKENGQCTNDKVICGWKDTMEIKSSEISVSFRLVSWGNDLFKKVENKKFED